VPSGPGITILEPHASQAARRIVCFELLIRPARFTHSSLAADKEETGMTQSNPFQQMDALHREIDRAFEDFIPQIQPSFPMAFLPGRLARAYPLINLHEDKDHIYVEAMAPGLDPESLNLTVVHNTLTISGEKKGAPDNIPPEAFHREERASGKFVRTITLPVEIDESKVEAEYKNGLLLITLPKSEKGKPKQINVQVS
jgi:HSP20 family protein